MRHQRETRRGGSGLALALAVVVIVGCGGGKSVGTGGLFVTVKDVSMATVADAVVSTDPATTTATTDALGTVLLDPVAEGFYAVTASHPGVGSARTPVTIRPGMLTEVTLTLRRTTAAPDAGPGDGGAGGGSGDSGTDAGGNGDAGGDAPVDPNLSVVLGAPTKDTNGVQLAWTIAGSFASYRIYRAVGSATPAVVDMLNAPAALAYRDDKITLGATYSYQIGGLTAAGQEVRSNVQTITAGVFISVNSQVERMMVDPRRPYLYAVDKVNNSLHFVNLTTKAVEKTIFIGSTPTDLSINLAGTELFVATFGATEIAVVNLETREKARSLIVDVSKGTWQGNPYRLVCTAGDTVVYTSDDQWNDLKLVSAATGAYVAAAGSIYYPALATSPDGTRVYVGESGSTGTAVIRFDVVGSTLKMMDSSTTLSFGSRQVNVSRDGMYVFYAGQKYLANNLKSVLGTFSETIVVSNGDGSIAIGATKIHNGTTFAAVKPLPLSTSIMALSPDDKTLYLYDMMTSRIYLYQL